MSVPYERIVQWTAGPIAVVAGWLSTVLVANVGVVGELGLNQNKVASGIVAAVTFVVSTGVTYAAHHKWLSNLPKWWDSQKLLQSFVPEAEHILSGSGASGGAAITAESILAEIDAHDAAINDLQNRSGTPPDQIASGLAPEGAPSTQVAGTTEAATS